MLKKNQYLAGKKCPCTLQLSLHLIIKLYILHNTSNKYSNVHFGIMFYAKYFKFLGAKELKINMLNLSLVSIFIFSINAVSKASFTHFQTLVFEHLFLLKICYQYTSLSFLFSMGNITS